MLAMLGTIHNALILHLYAARHSRVRLCVKAIRQLVARRPPRIATLAMAFAGDRAEWACLMRRVVGLVPCRFGAGWYWLESAGDAPCYR